MRPFPIGKISSSRTLWVNVLLILWIALLIILYNNSYQAKLRSQNLADLTNVNQSSANISSVFFQTQQKRLADAVQYITLRGLDRQEALAYICDANSDQSNYELVGADSTGFAAIRGANGYLPVSYTNANYADLQKLFAAPNPVNSPGIQCSGEFTDAISANKCFALYAYVRLADENGALQNETLLSVFKTSDFNGLINLDSGFDNIAAMLVNGEGDYILGAPAFKSENLFQYFYDFNGLTLDEKKQCLETFKDNGKGEFYYKNSMGEDCVYVYTTVADTPWYAVTSLPLSSYRYVGSDPGFTLAIAVSLLAMMIFNLVWLNRANIQLKSSVQKEKEASSAKTDFLSRMSHDIRTPLNVIIGSTLLASREDNPAPTAKYLENISASGKFLLSLINDILDLNKVESGKMELHLLPYSFTQFRAGLGAIIAPLCRDKDIHFAITSDSPDSAYLLDSVRVDQIFFNILSNSVKFTAPGGHIALNLHILTQEGDTDLLRFTASDDGEGMSPEFQAHMFESFTQEDGLKASEKQGSGLGLAIVRHLVDLMDGTIEVESAPGKGTVFTITLPARRADTAAAALPDVKVSPAMLRGKRILLVEDNKINAEIAGALLANNGMTVEHAADGADALQRFIDAPHGHFDAVLMDLRMPRMNGLDAARAIRALPRTDAENTPIIAMTANAYDSDVQNCLEAGMNAHVAKPIDPDALFITLAREIGAAENH